MSAAAIALNSSRARAGSGAMTGRNRIMIYGPKEDTMSSSSDG